MFIIRDVRRVSVTTVLRATKKDFNASNLINNFNRRIHDDETVETLFFHATPARYPVFLSSSCKKKELLCLLVKRDDDEFTKFFYQSTPT